MRLDSKNPGPLSRTEMSNSLSAPMLALIWINPPPAKGAIPCFTAFSTSGWIDKNGDRNRLGVGRHMDLESEFISQPKALHVQIGFDDVHLLFQGHQGLLGLQEIAKNIGQIQHGLARRELRGE